MGAPKRIWQLIKAIAIILGLAVTGLTLLFTYDMSTAYTSSNFQATSSTITLINSTHYSQTYTVSFDNPAILYTFETEITIEIFVNTTVDEAINSTAVSIFTNSSITPPGENSAIIINIILERELWDYATTAVIGFNNSITGILFNYSITTISFETYQQIK